MGVTSGRSVLLPDAFEWKAAFTTIFEWKAVYTSPTTSSSVQRVEKPLCGVQVAAFGRNISLPAVIAFPTCVASPRFRLEAPEPICSRPNYAHKPSSPDAVSVCIVGPDSA